MNRDFFQDVKQAFSESSAWRSRGYIPHFDQPDTIQSITIRLTDAVPVSIIEQWKKELGWMKKMPANDPRQVELRNRIAKYEDAGYGSCWLRDERIAALVQETILHFDGRRYRILAWCVMPNHIHVIIEMIEGYPLDKIIHSFQSYSAHKANKILSRTGPFWFHEYFDRFIRNEEHLADAIEYVEMNPVKARLVTSKDKWRWSSASLI